MNPNNARQIDMAHYARKEHFQYFRALGYPYVGVTVPVDITDFLTKTKEAGYPFFLSFLWCAAQSANAVPEFRQRICEDGIVEFSCCPTSHTVDKGDGTYCYCNLRCEAKLDTFIPYAMEAQRAAALHGDIAEDAKDTLELLFISTLPWLSYSALVQPVPFPADSNPRITWGRYDLQGDRVLMPLSVLCHHALVDGCHIARFYKTLDQVLADPFD